jgi:hypothetical protein
MKKGTQKLAAAVVSVIGISAASTARAAVIASENFSQYTSGTSATVPSTAAQLNGDGGANSGWAGAWNSTSGTPFVTSNGLTAPTSGLGQAASVAAQFNGESGTTNSASRILSSPVASGGSYYISFLFNVQDTNARSAVVILANATSGDALEIGDSYNPTNTNDDLGFQALNVNSGATDPSSVVATINTTFLLVADVEATGGTNGDGFAKLFVNPTSSTESADTVALTIQGTSTSALQAGLTTVSLFAGNGTSTTGANATYGDILIGTTFADVLPEPSSLAILCLPAMALLSRRRHVSAV